MNFTEYQALAHTTSGQTNFTQSAIMCSLGICGESGEVAEIIKKITFHQHPMVEKERICEELGDVLWYLSELAYTFDLTLESVAEQNIAKLRRRYPEGFSPERSQNRTVKG